MLGASATQVAIADGSAGLGMLAPWHTHAVRVCLGGHAEGEGYRWVEWGASSQVMGLSDTS